jgi:hypothetical protein
VVGEVCLLFVFCRSQNFQFSDCRLRALSSIAAYIDEASAQSPIAADSYKTSARWKCLLSSGDVSDATPQHQQKAPNDDDKVFNNYLYLSGRMGL